MFQLLSLDYQSAMHNYGSKITAALAGCPSMHARFQQVYTVLHWSAGHYVFMIVGITLDANAQEAALHRAMLKSASRQIYADLSTTEQWQLEKTASTTHLPLTKSQIQPWHILLLCCQTDSLSVKSQWKELTIAFPQRFTPHRTSKGTLTSHVYTRF